MLDAVAARSGHHFDFAEHADRGRRHRRPRRSAAGGDARGMPGSRRRAARRRRRPEVGRPDGQDPAGGRPAGIRKALGLYANLRPVRSTPTWPGRRRCVPRRLVGVDILFVRELTGGIYFGPSGVSADGTEAFSTMAYSAGEIERIVRVAADAARDRRGRLTSVDKANVLEVSRLWRRVAAAVVAAEYPDLAYDVVLVDAMAMHLLSAAVRLRRRRHRQPVRRHPHRRGVDDRRVRWGMLPSASLGDRHPGCTSRSTAPPPTSPAPARPTRSPPSSPRPWRSVTRSGWRTRRRRSRRPWTMWSPQVAHSGYRRRGDLGLYDGDGLGGRRAAEGLNPRALVGGARSVVSKPLPVIRAGLRPLPMPPLPASGEGKGQTTDCLIWVSISSLTFLETSTPPPSSATFQVRPQSSRSTSPAARSRPWCCPRGPGRSRGTRGRA